MNGLVVELVTASKSSVYIQELLEVLNSSRKFRRCNRYFFRNYILPAIQKYLVQMKRKVWNLK